MLFTISVTKSWITWKNIKEEELSKGMIQCCKMYQLQSPFGFVLLDISSDFGLAEQFVHHNDQLDLLNKEDTKAVNKKKVASKCWDRRTKWLKTIRLLQIILGLIQFILKKKNRRGAWFCKRLSIGDGLSSNFWNYTVSKITVNLAKVC